MTEAGYRVLPASARTFFMARLIILCTLRLSGEVRLEFIEPLPTPQILELDQMADFVHAIEAGIPNPNSLVQ